MNNIENLKTERTELMNSYVNIKKDEKILYNKQNIELLVEDKIDTDVYEQ